MAAPHHHSHLPGASLAVPGSLKASTTSARSAEFGDRLIARADALLEGSDADFRRPFVAALRALFGAVDRSRTGE